MTFLRHSLALIVCILALCIFTLASTVQAGNNSKCPYASECRMTMKAIKAGNYTPGPKFVSPTDQAWETFAKDLGLPRASALTDFQMVLRQALRGQEKPEAVATKVKIGAQAVCDQCKDDPGLRICVPCRKAGRL